MTTLESKNLHMDQGNPDRFVVPENDKIGRNFSPWYHWVPAVVWAAVLFVLSAQPAAGLPSVDVPYADKIVHFAVYGVLGLSLRWPLRRRHWLVPVAVTALYGITDELHQLLVPGRSFEIADMAADLFGALLGVRVGKLMGKVMARQWP